MESVEFKEFPKMARLSREMVVTEKIDGTNASVCIGENGEFMVGSRTRWITPENDNYGFAKWAYAHKDELMTLGKGRHFGEWWGSGIQRGYGLPSGDKRFSLFNTITWCLHGAEPQPIPTGDPKNFKMQKVLPACVGLVPVLYKGMFDTAVIEETLNKLKVHGSYASPFLNPEGIVAFHVASGICFKKTLDGDGHKGAR